jgi:predicted XRE-type DNA-binding protein
MGDDDKITVGSDNIFADLGLPDADELMAKAILRHEILDILKARKMTEAQFAEVCGLTKSKAEKFLSGRERRFSTTDLMGFLTSLGQDVEIVVSAPRQRRPANKGKLTVRAA